MDVLRGSDYIPAVFVNITYSTAMKQTQYAYKKGDRLFILRTQWFYEILKTPAILWFK